MVAPQHFDAAISLVDAPQPISLPKSFVVEVDLIYPQGYHLDKEAMADQLLRNASIHQTAPFALIQESVQKLPAENSSLIHEKISYQLEPQFPGKYALTFYEISFLPNDLNVVNSVKVVSPIIYVDVVLPEAPVINLAAEAAPLSDLSERVPIEMVKEIRVHISQDQSSRNVELFKKKELPWNLAAGLIFVSLLFVGTLFLFNYLKKKKPTPPVKSKQIPLDEAEKLLAELKRQPVLNSSTVENFIHQLTSSLREYFEDHFKIATSALTTQEFLEDVKTSPQLNQEKKVSIAEIFQLADQIKFGGYKPSLGECTQIFEKVQKLNLFL